MTERMQKRDLKMKNRQQSRKKLYTGKIRKSRSLIFLFFKIKIFIVCTETHQMLPRTIYSYVVLHFDVLP